MRRGGRLLIALAVVLFAVRLFTGIVYGDGEAVAYFVVKPVPDLRIERTATATNPVRRDIVLTSDEIGLVFGDAYVSLMRAAPVLGLILLAAGVWGVRRRV